MTRKSRPSETAARDRPPARHSAVNASNSTPGTKVATTCTESDDKQIEQAIRISINEDADLRRQFKHINYDSKFCEIRLHGWIDTWANFKKLHERINGVDGVGKIHLLKFDVRSTSAAVEECRPPFKKCGELCIPEDDDCNIITDIAAGPAPYPSGTPK